MFAGDGAPLETGASPYGKKICQCQGRCSCQRRYSDPTATWGWDSYHERWFYGHTLYCLTAADSPNDLPLMLHITEGARHDSVSFVKSLPSLLSLYPQFKFTKGLLDSAHDAYPIYQLLYHYSIEPFIDLNNRNKANRSYPGPLELTDEGVPICPANLPMLNWGFNQDRCRIKWRCPLYKKLHKCPKGMPCSSSKYGPVVYTKPAWDYRFFTPTPRDSKEWKITYAKRTSVERTLKRILVDYAIEQYRVRSIKGWFWLASLAAINQHLDAQIAVINRDSLFLKLGLSKKVVQVA